MYVSPGNRGLNKQQIILVITHEDEADAIPELSTELPEDALPSK